MSYATSLMQNNTCYAALDKNTGIFQGVIAISPEQTIHSFCVRDSARGKGVGKALMNYVIRLHASNDNLFLTIAQPVSKSISGYTVLVKRHNKLYYFYKSFGFDLDESFKTVQDGYTHMARLCR